VKRRLLRTAVIAVWLVMAAWLARYEAFPEYFSRRLDGYRSLIRRDVLMDDAWMRILFNGSPIGYSHSSLEVNEGSVARQYRLENRTELRLKLLGETQRVAADTEAHLDALCALREFSFALTAGAYRLRLKGVRAEGQRFRVALRAGESAQHLTVEIPDDVVLYAPLVELAVRRLRPGQALTLRTFDPATLATAPLTIRALRREPLALGGRSEEALVVATEYQGAAFLAWLDAEGRVLREETPFGWTLERCTAEEAFAALAAGGAAQDLLRGLAVKCQGRVRDPARPLRLRLSGVSFRPEELASERQAVERWDAAAAEVRLLPATPPARPDAAVAGPELAAFLASTPLVQSDHPEIVDAARRIVGARTGAWEKAEALCDWVYANVRKEMTVSLPSALDVLRTRRGDCNEHTVLFAALARAAGLPAKIRVGLAHHEEAFYYHAWPAVWVGEWVELDPTWGQRTVDAAHLGLAEGELSDQLALLKVLGRLAIRVLEETDGETP